MGTTNTTFQEFRAYWRLSKELIASASKEDIAEAARILAMQAAHYARKYGEVQLPDIAHLLDDSTLGDDNISLLRYGTEALVGMIAMVSGEGGVDLNKNSHGSSLQTGRSPSGCLYCRNTADTFNQLGFYKASIILL